jgi:phosphatidylserine/phosphatidylglycerophosphate/cardiolipin synthase-like enzyme
MKISDRAMIKLLQERVKAGVDVRIIGKVAKKAEGLTAEKMPGMRLHVRAMLRDQKELFLGSMSLRALELDKRREVGVIVKERRAAKQFKELFEDDWSKTDIAKKKAEKDKKIEKKEEKREAAAAAS